MTQDLFDREKYEKLLEACSYFTTHRALGVDQKPYTQKTQEVVQRKIRNFINQEITRNVREFAESVRPLANPMLGSLAKETYRNFCEQVNAKIDAELSKLEKKEGGK